MTAPIATLIADACVAALARAAVIGHGCMNGTATMLMTALMADPCWLRRPALRLCIGHRSWYDIVTTTVATVIADAWSPPLARVATIGHEYSSGSVTTPMATVIADAHLAPLVCAAIVCHE